MNHALAFLSMPGGWELVVILVVGLLIFGRRLPEIGRSVGRTIVEFKKGLRDVHEDINTSANSPDTKSLPSKPQNPEQLPPQQ